MTEKSIFRDKKEKGEEIKECNLQKQYFDLIKTGKKTVEGRINSGSFQNLRVGSKIKFFEQNDPRNFLICEVIEINSYSSFREMLESEGVENMLPSTKSLEQGVKVYEQIPGFKKRCEKYGCLGLKIKVLE